MSITSPSLCTGVTGAMVLRRSLCLWIRRSKYAKCNARVSPEIEMVNDKEHSKLVISAACEDNKFSGFTHLKTQQDMICAIKAEAEAGKIPSDIAFGMNQLVYNYRNAAPFDASAVDNMRRLTQHAGVPGHIYPLAVLCYDIMPPPSQVNILFYINLLIVVRLLQEKITFHGTGLSVAPEIDFLEIAAACEDPELALYDSATEQYSVLTRAVHGQEGLEASTPSVSLPQPWF